MDIQNSFSRLKKKVSKHLGSKRKPGKTGADFDGESANPTDPPPRPGSYVVADDGSGNGAGAGGQQTGLIGQPPQPDEPEPMPANRGENDQRGGQADIDGREVSQTHSRPHPDVEVGAGSGPGREGNGADREEDGHFYPRLPTRSILHRGEPDGALMLLFKLLPSSLSHNIDTTVPNDAPEALHPNASAKPSAATDETTLESTTAIKLLHVVRDSVNGFGPLKSVAGDLCLVLENCKV